MVGCGNIAETQLEAYRNLGLNVRVLCDIDAKRATACRAEYYPDADVTTEYQAVLDRDDVAVVDVTLPPGPRAEVIADCVRAGKHVLSQKPFVTDREVGERLVSLAGEHGVRLAVNQNVRWAPHYRYIREAVREGTIGAVHGASLRQCWDYNRIEGDGIPHRLLFYYAIHWFDVVRLIMGGEPPDRVYTATAGTPTQRPSQPIVSHSVLEYDHGLVSLSFDGDTRTDSIDETYLVGETGVIDSRGSTLDDQSVTVRLRDGERTPELTGTWNPGAFGHSMAELLASIADDREPLHSGADNLRTLDVAFAAVRSAETGAPVQPGEIGTLPER